MYWEKNSLWDYKYLVCQAWVFDLKLKSSPLKNKLLKKINKLENVMLI